MASTLAAPKSHNLPHFIGKNYEIALNQSIEALLTSLSNRNPGNLSSFITDFRALMQSKADPPLETIWVFAALTFTSHRTPDIEPLGRILAIKDLFQLIVSCSASCNSLKSIALVAPVIYTLHTFILELKGLQLGSKRVKKVKNEIGSLVDSVVGYINVCCDGFVGNFEDLDDLVRPLGELISFWIVENGNVESLSVFLPLLSDNAVTRVSKEGCGMVDLAGFVITEAFLLKLGWKFQDGFGEKTQNELNSWIVGSITGFRNSYFYVTLASMLLEPLLPTTSIMNTEHGEGLRKILLDSIVLAEYSFLSPECMDQIPKKHAKRVNLTRLMVADEAVNLMRVHGEHTKAASYLNAFVMSSLPTQLLKWIRSDFGNELSANEPTGSSPRAYLRWMLNIENRGIKIFDDDMSTYHAKLMSHDDVKEETEQLAIREEGKNLNSDLFYIDNKREQKYGIGEDEDTSKCMSAAFMAAAHSMESSENGGRKRKAKKGEKMKKVKFVKYNLVENSSLPGERSAVPRNEDSNSRSEIENPYSSGDD